jgi:DNA invertase Pin-like site-specific DNA recombinase
MKIVAYIRTSNAFRTEHGFGHDVQEQACRRWAESFPGSEFLVFRDLVVSGSIPFTRRKALCAALRELGRGDVLVVYKRDRLGRDLIDMALLQKTVARMGARIFSLSGEGNGDSYEDAFTRSIIDCASEYERNMIRKRTQAAIRIKVQRNLKISGEVQFGCQLAPDGVHLMPHPSEFPTLLEMYRLYDLGLSPCKISTKISKQGLYSRSGGPWHDSCVIRLIKMRQTHTERFLNPTFLCHLREMNLDLSPLYKIMDTESRIDEEQRRLGIHSALQINDSKSYICEDQEIKASLLQLSLAAG